MDNALSEVRPETAARIQEIATSENITLDELLTQMAAAHRGRSSATGTDAWTRLFLQVTAPPENFTPDPEKALVIDDDFRDSLY